jgi:hypothetical protein
MKVNDIRTQQTAYIKPEIRHSPRLIGKKTFLEKMNSENLKGLF